MLIKVILIFMIIDPMGVQQVRTQEFSSWDNCRHAGRMMQAMTPKNKRPEIIWECVKK